MYIFAIFLFLGLTSASIQHGHRKPYGHDRGSHYERETCSHPRDSCVLNEDCEIDCPPIFASYDESGACYFISQDPGNEPRTQKEARNFCETLGADLLYIEDSNELPELSDAFPAAALEYFLDAVYSKEDSEWIWENNDDEIKWNVILQNFGDSAANIDAINSAPLSSCFTVNLATRTIQARPCTERHFFICKMGQARDDCSDSSQSRCCFSPSYSYYIRNQQHGIGYNQNFEIGLENCQFRVNNVLRPCDEVLDEVRIAAPPRISLVRVDSSYYYFAEAAEECLIREAVISSSDVHHYVMAFMATQEADFAGQNVKIGLRFTFDDDKGKWVNGKGGNYYDTYWAPGQPNLNNADGGCAAYGNVQGTAIVLWTLFPAAECDAFMKICELPIFRLPGVRRRLTQTCGKRRERGVLAKSSYARFDHTEANFGEFPWQTALFEFKRVGTDVKKTFKCSGALIHPRFVLTSAHCVALNEPKDILLSFGNYNLDSKGLLKTITAKASEIIMHHGFSLRQDYLDDIALIQLENPLDTSTLPHIGLACLPSPEELHSHAGGWECYAVGWPKGDYKGRTLTRIPVTFTSEEFCRYSNRRYYAALRERSYYQRQSYDDLKKHGYYSSDAELLCTESEEECLDESTPILVCKKKTHYRGHNFLTDFDHPPQGSQRQRNRNQASQRSKSYESRPDTLNRVREANRRARKDSLIYEVEGRSTLNKIQQTDRIKDHGIHTPKADNTRAYTQTGRETEKGPKYRPAKPVDEEGAYVSTSRDQLYSPEVEEFDFIINSYGEEKFDSDTWYVMGIGNGLSLCSSERGYSHQRRKYTRVGNQRHDTRSSNNEVNVFTSVYEYLPFINIIEGLF